MIMLFTALHESGIGTHSPSWLAPEGCQSVRVQRPWRAGSGWPNIAAEVDPQLSSARSHDLRRSTVFEFVSSNAMVHRTEAEQHNEISGSACEAGFSSCTTPLAPNHAPSSSEALMHRAG
jgi:hypothetical protein